jgi:hypothetical protein
MHTLKARGESAQTARMRRSAEFSPCQYPQFLPDRSNALGIGDVGNVGNDQDFSLLHRSMVEAGGLFRGAAADSGVKSDFSPRSVWPM